MLYKKDAAQYKLEQRSQPSEYTYVEAADDSESEQSVGSQHLAILDSWPLADPSDNLYDQDACSNDQPSEQTAMSLTLNESHISQYPSREHKHNLEQGRDSQHPYIEAADATMVELGSRSLSILQEARKDSWLSIAAATLPTPPQTIVRSQHPSPVPPGVDLLNRGSGKFTQLFMGLRTKLGRIADITTLATVWDYLNYK
ncbi:hypothetical protein B7494_g5767 [Chlorociboria aeruginascens]|nr:hypothetical protein B7494_g5767 [Chlorociboria aeruginascens]